MKPSTPLLALTLLLPSLGHAKEAPNTCQITLHYGMPLVHLTGMIRKKTYPGPPNYQNIQSGDKVERVLILESSKKLCIKSDKQDPTTEPENNIRAVQLVFLNPHLKPHINFSKPKLGTVVGSLFHAQSGHHHTRVLLGVEDIHIR